LVVGCVLIWNIGVKNTKKHPNSVFIVLKLSPRPTQLLIGVRLAYVGESSRRRGSPVLVRADTQCLDNRGTYL